MAVLRLLLLVAIALPGTSDAQTPANERQPVRAAFESNQLRVQRVSIAAGDRAELREHRDALLIPFGAGLDGGVRPGEVAWHAAGTTTLENRGTGTFTGILVELTAPPSGTPAPLPPEVAADRVPGYRPVYRVEGHRVRTVIDDPRVLVTRHRLPAWQPRTEPRHFHDRELVLVYLAGGEIRGSTGRLGDRRVRRGDFDVLPANVLHAFDNVGNDPIEFLMITPR